MTLVRSLIAASLFATPVAAQVAPPSEPHQFAFTLTGPDRVALIDLASAERAGDVIDVWTLYVMAQPTTALGTEPADAFWIRMRMDCAAREGRFTHGVAIADGAVIHEEAIEQDPSPFDASWALDEAYACKGEPPIRPIVSTFAEAMTSSHAIMSDPAWTAGLEDAAPATTEDNSEETPAEPVQAHADNPE